MSDYEHWKGKLIQIPSLENETFEDTIIRVLKDNKIDISGCNNYMEAFYNNMYRKMIIVNKKIYKIIAEELDPYDDVYNAVLTKDGSIEFIVKYYNGGQSFDEAIETAIKKLEENK